MWTVLQTPSELAAGIGERIRRRRLSLGYTQIDAAARARVAHRTWRRMEREGRASIDNLVRAAIALRCEERLAELFPEQQARTMDELLRRQRRDAERAGRQAHHRTKR